MVVGENDSIEYKPAKDIKLGDEVWAVVWDELQDERTVDSYTWSDSAITNMHFEKTVIANIIPSVKDITVLINNDSTKRYSLEETVLVKRNGIYFFGSTGTLEPGDILTVKNENNEFEDLLITSIDTIDEQRTVYQFDAEPGDILVAGNIVVHNAKGFA